MKSIFIWLIIAVILYCIALWPRDEKPDRRQKHIQDKYRQLNQDKARRIAELEKQQSTMAKDEALSALVSLGYRKTQAQTAIAKAATELDDQASTADWIRAALNTD